MVAVRRHRVSHVRQQSDGVAGRDETRPVHSVARGPGGAVEVRVRHHNPGGHLRNDSGTRSSGPDRAEYTLRGVSGALDPFL